MAGWRRTLFKWRVRMVTTHKVTWNNNVPGCFLGLCSVLDTGGRFSCLNANAVSHLFYLISTVLSFLPWLEQ